MHTHPPSQRPCVCSGATQAELQAALLTAVRGLAELVAQLSTQLGGANGAHTSAAPAPEAWCQPLPPELAGRCGPIPDHSPGHGAQPSPGQGPGLRLIPAWEDLSVVELRALLRSYPIDRSSLPAPIEVLRRGELLEALSQLQAMSA
ncbi:hypothetical protein KBY76_00785 [Synechococcus sp. GreenBA-s]|nr:hypothetical protein [Synechococcus sp. GreenBA-s]